MMSILLLLQGARMVIFFGALILLVHLVKTYFGIWENRATPVQAVQRKTAR
jgi:hypothetical protein